MGSLEGRTALITGSSRGLGAELALAFAAKGANVVVNYRANRERAEAVAAAARELGVEVLVIGADCTEEAEVERLVDAAVNTFGEIRVLVNNAGVSASGSFVETTVDAWDDMMASHLRSHFLVSR